MSANTKDNEAPERIWIASPVQFKSLISKGGPAFDNDIEYRRVDPPTGKPDGVEVIRAERKRQVLQKGYTREHDDAHRDQSLVKAAVCYATPNRTAVQAVELWPWENPPTVHHNINNSRGREYRIRELSKAGALIAAEIDRLLRMALEGL